jgi:polyisoprenoid-binding protein YceI
MRTLLLLPAALLLAAFALAPAAPQAPEASAPTFEPGAYTIDQSHSTVGFRVRHLGISNVSGSFSDYDATLTFDPSDLRTLRTSATVRVASIDTRNERRDNHLRSDDFFDAERFPEMRFVSTGVRNVSGNRFQIEGDLTIRDVTRRVVLEGELVGQTTGGQGEPRVALEATTTIDRFDYGLTWDRMTEAGGLVASREVRISLDIAAVRAAV